MTIFDSKPFQINPSSNSRFCDTFDMPTWSFHNSDNYKNKAGISNPKRSKKKVTFADDNGQDLIHVVTIDNTNIPDLDFALMYEKSHNHVSKVVTEDKKVISTNPYEWVTSFIQPASVYGRFKSELSKHRVKLATAVINKHQTSTDDPEFEMTGIIKLVNLCYEKRVFIRLSSDANWTSFSDCEAKYKNSSSEFLPSTSANCDIDEFEFQISLPKTENEDSHLEFVVGLETPEKGSFWDNNGGKNYRIDYCQISVDKFPHGISPSNPYTRDYKPNLEPFQRGFTGYRAWNHFSEELNFY